MNSHAPAWLPRASSARWNHGHCKAAQVAPKTTDTTAAAKDLRVCESELIRALGAMGSFVPPNVRAKLPA
jgi:hypothetical protein